MPPVRSVKLYKLSAFCNRTHISKIPPTDELKKSLEITSLVMTVSVHSNRATLCIAKKQGHLTVSLMPKKLARLELMDLRWFN